MIQLFLKLIFTMLVCGTITLHADENDTKYAQKAVIFSRDRAIFSGETSDPDYNIKYAYSLNDDGERLIRENIFTKSTRMVTVNLILADEIYQIDDYAVLKVERDNNKGGWLTYLYNTGSVYSLCPHTTAIEPVIYENIPCNKVTLTISGSAGDMAAAMGHGITEEMIRNSPDDYPEKIIYIIGREIPFVYAIEYFNAKGDKIPVKSFALKNVKLVDALPAETFALPQNRKIEVTRSDSDTEKIYANTMEPEYNSPVTITLIIKFTIALLALLAILLGTLITVKIIRKKHLR